MYQSKKNIKKYRVNDEINILVIKNIQSLIF